MTQKFHIILIALLLFSCDYQDASQISNTKENVAALRNPIDYVKNYNGENNKLFAFVGQKILLDTLPYRKGSMDKGYKAKYRIIERIFGNFQEDTIEFIVYDHMGTPQFSRFENVLLYVSADSGTYYHQKYLFNDVYMTKCGRWAGTYVEADYGHTNNVTTSLKPVLIDFAEEVSYPSSWILTNNEIKNPKKYFKIIGEQAIATHGNYADDLFILKRDGFLTARQIFVNGKLNE